MQRVITDETRGKVFMVVNGNWREGGIDIPTFVISQAESLRCVGWKVVFGLVDDRTSLRGILRNIRRLRREIAQHEPLVIHAQYGSVTVAVANVIKADVPLVVSFCGDDLLGTPAAGLYWRVRGQIARLIGLWGSRGALAVIVKSRNLLQSLPANMRNKASVLPNGVDTAWFTPMSRELCRASLGWQAGGKIVLFNASRNEDQHRKNPALAHKAVHFLSRSVPDVSLAMLSNASRDQVRLMLNAADCLLVTSLHEGSPNIVKEAMACNLPVVSVPCGDVAERLKHVYPGSISAYDAGALAEAMQKVFAADSRSNGRDQLIAQGLTLNNVAENLACIYQSVLEAHSLTLPLRPAMN